ncbi:hypothetical protein [Pontibacter sp. G13]|uniref:hypothetical protein n=1 Tax=Pontibacter sp. G13 TaxID=3074898 RepID=UPI002889BFB2|nr:hypothetical protein [Pontibacter sp. G13]WNJ17234.1 hypothetical protein RJD25_20455 [Pontibacter sp. G13]
MAIQARFSLNNILILLLIFGTALVGLLGPFTNWFLLDQLEICRMSFQLLAVGWLVANGQTLKRPILYRTLLGFHVLIAIGYLAQYAFGGWNFLHLFVPVLVIVPTLYTISAFKTHPTRGYRMYLKLIWSWAFYASVLFKRFAIEGGDALRLVSEIVLIACVIIAVVDMVKAHTLFEE